MTSILIIEDHVGLREAYQLLFVKEGYQVELAEDGKTGLDLVATNSYDVILLDMIMPKTSGIEFLRVFKPLEHPKTKVIVFSNLQSEDLVKEAMDLGAKRYLTKSILPPKKMAEIVSGILNEQ